MPHDESIVGLTASIFIGLCVCCAIGGCCLLFFLVWTGSIFQGYFETVGIGGKNSSTKSSSRVQTSYGILGMD